MEERQMEKQPKVGTTFRWHTDKVLEYLRGVLAGGEAGLDRKRVYAADGDLCFLPPAVLYGEKQTFHVFHDLFESPDRRTTLAHEHQLGYRSHVIAGRVTNIRYLRVSDGTIRHSEIPDDAPTIPGYNAVYSEKLGIRALFGDDASELTIRSIRSFGPGETYTQPRGRLHKTVAEAYTITVVGWDELASNPSVNVAAYFEMPWSRRESPHVIESSVMLEVLREAISRIDGRVDT